MHQITTETKTACMFALLHRQVDLRNSVDDSRLRPEIIKDYERQLVEIESALEDMGKGSIDDANS